MRTRTTTTGIVAFFLGLTLGIAPAEAQVLKRGRVYNQSDVEVVVRIIGIGESQNIRKEIDVGARTEIFPLATGERFVVVWDAFNETILVSKKLPVAGNTRIQVTGNATNGYQLAVGYVDEDP